VPTGLKGSPLIRKPEFPEFSLREGAEKFSLSLVSFDEDFDRTDRKRILPSAIH
jgi:hypothetical protein